MYLYLNKRRVNQSIHVAQPYILEITRESVIYRLFDQENTYLFLNVFKQRPGILQHSVHQYDSR